MNHQTVNLQLFSEETATLPDSSPPIPPLPPNPPSPPSVIRMTWEEILQDPEYSHQMEETVRARIEAEQNSLKTPEHFAELETQAHALQKLFPAFDLQTELQNPAFARMIAPGKGNMRMEDAYYAIHRHEIHTAAMQETARKTAEMIANAIQSGSRRPNESGASSQAPSVCAFDYAKASREQREAFKKDLRLKMAKGEKVYPMK